jgi:hypothetical protein
MTDDLPQQFKDMGPAALRTLMQSGGLAPTFNRAAVAWLSEQDQLAASRLEEREASRDAIARDALRTAKAANSIATKALIVAIVAIVASIVIAVMTVPKA